MSALEYDEIALQRIIAFLIDVSVVSFFVVLIAKVLNLNRNLNNYLFIILFGLYYISFTLFTERQTIGKSIFNLKVIDKDTSEITLAKLFVKVILITPILFILYTFFSQMHFYMIKSQEQR